MKARVSLQTTNNKRLLSQQHQFGHGHKTFFFPDLFLCLKISRVSFINI